MNNILQNIRSWAWNFDLMTDAFYIEEDRQRGSRELTEIKPEEARSLSQQKINSAIAEIGEVVLILSAVMIASWPVVALLWSH